VRKFDGGVAVDRKKVLGGERLLQFCFSTKAVRPWLDCLLADTPSPQGLRCDGG
jgi:hypothetical protein